MAPHPNASSWMSDLDGGRRARDRRGRRRARSLDDRSSTDDQTETGGARPWARVRTGELLGRACWSTARSIAACGRATDGANATATGAWSVETQIGQSSAPFEVACGVAEMPVAN